jgi:hypothetical protein
MSQRNFIHRIYVLAARLETATVPKILDIIPSNMSPDISEDDLERFVVERLRG